MCKLLLCLQNIRHRDVFSFQSHQSAHLSLKLISKVLITEPDKPSY